MASDAERAAAYRARKRGGPPRELAPCGTRSAYVRHLRNGEDACDACKKANTDYQRDNKRKLRAAANAHYVD